MGLIINEMYMGPLEFPIGPWRLITPKKVKAYRRLRTERIDAGRFFDVTCEFGHTHEMTGVDLCRHLDGLGESILCPSCVKWVKVIRLVEGRVMTVGEKELQEKDYSAWLDEMERARSYVGGGGAGFG